MFFKASLRQLCLEDKRPWLVGFSGNVGPSAARPRPKALRPYKRGDSFPAAEQIRPPVYGLLSPVIAALSTVCCPYDSRQRRNDRRHASPLPQVLRAKQPEY